MENAETQVQRALRRFQEREATGINRDQQMRLEAHRQAQLGNSALAAKAQEMGQRNEERLSNLRARHEAEQRMLAELKAQPLAEPSKPQLDGDIIILCPKGPTQKLRIFRDEGDKYVEATFAGLYELVQKGADWESKTRYYDSLRVQNHNYEKRIADDRDKIVALESALGKALVQRDKAERELRNLRGKR